MRHSGASSASISATAPMRDRGILNRATRSSTRWLRTDVCSSARCAHASSRLTSWSLDGGDEREIALPGIGTITGLGATLDRRAIVRDLHLVHDAAGDHGVRRRQAHGDPRVALPFDPAAYVDRAGVVSVEGRHADLDVSGFALHLRRPRRRARFGETGVPAHRLRRVQHQPDAGLRSVGLSLARRRRHHRGRQPARRRRVRRRLAPRRDARAQAERVRRFHRRGRVARIERPRRARPASRSRAAATAACWSARAWCSGPSSSARRSAACRSPTCCAITCSPSAASGFPSTAPPTTPADFAFLLALLAVPQRRRRHARIRRRW